MSNAVLWTLVASGLVFGFTVGRGRGVTFESDAAVDAHADAGRTTVVPQSARRIFVTSRQFD